MSQRLTQDALRKAAVYIGEKNYYERNQLRDLFIAQGLKQIVCHADIDSLRELLLQIPPDLLVVADDFGEGVFELIREIRQQRIGDNPFMLISMLVGATHGPALDRAIDAGVDDIIIKPLTAERVRERLRLVTFHRRPFIATEGYVGPERKTENQRAATARRFPVVNTLFEKVSGREMDKHALKAAVEGSLQKVLQAQLDSQSFRLGEVCERLVVAYDTGAITDEVQAGLLTLADVLKDAASVAERLKDTQLSALCLSLAENVNQMADHFDAPTIAEIDLIRKVTTAFKVAMKPAPAEEGQPGSLDLSQYQ